jgi:hypothetical protein
MRRVAIILLLPAWAVGALIASVGTIGVAGWEAGREGFKDGWRNLPAAAVLWTIILLSVVALIVWQVV